MTWSAPRLFARIQCRRALGALPGQAAGLVAHVGDGTTPEAYPWQRVTENLDTHLRALVLDFGLPHLLRVEDRNSMAC